jgi:hypothetical protein
MANEIIPPDPEAVRKAFRSYLRHLAKAVLIKLEIKPTSAFKPLVLPKPRPRSD